MNAPVPEKRRLRTLLTVPFTLLILMPALMIALTSLYTGLRAVDTLSERVITDVSSRVEQAAVHQLEEATITLRSVVPEPSDSFDGSISPFMDRVMLERKLFELTAATRTTGYLYYGAEDGSFLGVDRGRPGARAAATVRIGEREGQPRKIYSARAPEDRSRLHEVETRLYDARVRPWYLKARTTGQLAWTSVYVSFASGSLVTTAAAPVSTRDGRLLGVLAADVELSELSAFMKNVSVSANGVAFIVDSEGYLVASSAPGLPYKDVAGVQQRIRIDESTNETERDAAVWWRATRAAPAQPGGAGGDNKIATAKIVAADGDAIDVATRRIAGIEGVDWSIVVAIPRSDLTAPLVRNAIVMFAVIVAALIASLQLGLWIVRRVTRDVDALVRATNTNTLQPEQFVLPTTALQETSVLASAFAAMFDRLRDSLGTIRKQNEDLAALNATLEERVERRTRQLEVKNTELTDEVSRREQLEVDLRAATEVTVKQADDKARFMAMLSHELRTPLQAVIGAGALLATKSHEHSEEADILDAAAKSVLTLVDGVLSYSKLEAGKVTPLRSSFALAEVINQAIILARAAQREYRPTVSVSINNVPARIRTDAGMLRQVIVNLVSNAIKHAKDGQIEVCLSRRALPDADGGASQAVGDGNLEPHECFQLHVSVADDGPGIPENARHLLFQPFQQIGRGAADPSQGSGLGLAICAMLVRALDGDIRHATRPRQGTEIEFDLRVEADTASELPGARVGEAARLAIDAESEATSRHVLLVDDHRVNLRLVSELLKVQGHQTTLADTGQAAIAAVRERLEASRLDPSIASFEVVFMDLNLPDISGIEAVVAIRALCSEQKAREPHFIALTASTSQEDVKRCAAVGMNLLVTKPATVQSLQAVLRRAFSSAGEKSSARAPEFASAAASVIDAAILAQLCDVGRRGGRAFAEPLVEDYLAGLDKEFADVVRAVEAGNKSAAQAFAHALSGASVAVGARALADRLRAPRFTAHVDQLAELIDCREQTRDALQKWLVNQRPRNDV